MSRTLETSGLGPFRQFVTCNGISGAHYLLATMMGAMPMAPQTALKLGLGLCVPEARGNVVAEGHTHTWTYVTYVYIYLFIYFYGIYTFNIIVYTYDVHAACAYIMVDM